MRVFRCVGARDQPTWHWGYRSLYRFVKRMSFNGRGCPHGGETSAFLDVSPSRNERRANQSHGSGPERHTNAPRGYPRWYSLAAPRRAAPRLASPRLAAPHSLEPFRATLVFCLRQMLTMRRALVRFSPTIQPFAIYNRTLRQYYGNISVGYLYTSVHRPSRVTTRRDSVVDKWGILVSTHVTRWSSTNNPNSPSDLTTNSYMNRFKVKVLLYI